MPNHETNYVVVVGDPAPMKGFLDEAFSPGDTTAAYHPDPELVLDFNLIVPQPENIEQGGCNGKHAEGEVCWYDWNVSHWGTKWGAYHHEERVIGGTEAQVEVRLQFETAWTAPTPIFQAIEERWGVAVHAITLDEGGAPPEFYGDPSDYMYVNTSVEFAS